MRAALIVLLVACGSERREEPKRAPEANEPRGAEGKLEEPKRDPVVAPSCKPGDTVCDGDAVMMCEADGNQRKVTACRGGCKQGACVETCGANDVELIYVVDTDSTLFSFDPRKLPRDPFKRIGKLSCDPSSYPNSMAVDRGGIAWVAYQTGTLYQVSIIDGHCFSQSSKPEGAPVKFGMGFVTDGPKATTEKLYVVEFGGRDFATIEVEPPTRWVSRGKLTVEQEYNPELSGTGEGRLYGYFPGRDSRGFVQEIDRKTGAALGRRWSLPAGREEVGAWAFAFWGDVFYTFITFRGKHEVHAIHRKTGKHELVIENAPYEVVGAGVSTCAPLLEKRTNARRPSR